MKALVAAALLAVASLTPAAELNLGLYTTHVGIDGLNEENHLVGLSLDDYEVGTYFNSYRIRSYYAARRFEFNDSIGVMIGSVSGYSWACVQGQDRCHDDDLIPMFATYWRITDYFTIIEMANAFMLTVSIPIGD